jgi:hypothetical protein
LFRGNVFLWRFLCPYGALVRQQTFFNETSSVQVNSLPADVELLSYTLGGFSFL